MSQPESPRPSCATCAGHPARQGGCQVAPAAASLVAYPMHAGQPGAPIPWPHAHIPPPMPCGGAAWRPAPDPLLPGRPPKPAGMTWREYYADYLPRLGIDTQAARARRAAQTAGDPPPPRVVLP